MHTFTVIGTGPFPLSMLRFDNCWPYTDEDANEIEQSLSGGRGPWTVTLQTCRHYAPTVGRWDSFNVSIIQE